jgi:hypothetical protein
MNWTYVLDDAELPEGQMTAAYPLGVNVVLYLRFIQLSQKQVKYLSISTIKFK